MRLDIPKNVFLTVLIVSAFGCNRHQMETSVVRGTVALDGKPVPKGTVMFSPRAGRAAHGVIKPDGKFELTTYREGDGAIVGENKVSVFVAFGENVTQEDFDKYRLPSKYASAATSEIVQDVKPGVTNEVNLKLKSK